MNSNPEIIWVVLYSPANALPNALENAGTALSLLHPVRTCILILFLSIGNKPEFKYSYLSSVKL
jgi:hypothetical protein